MSNVKYIQQVILFLLSFFILVGVVFLFFTHLSSNNNSPKSTEKAAQSQSQSSFTESPFLSDSQVNKLDNYMDLFSKTMNQPYKRYFPVKANQKKLNFYGFDIVNQLSGFNYQVDELPASLSFSRLKSELKPDNYNILAVYCDSDNPENHTNGNRHLYLFTSYHNQPRVLVTMQNQGNNEQIMYFNPTKNTDISSNFSNIFYNN